MRTLYIDCSMGAAGDMLTAALLELLPDKEDFVEKLNGLGLGGVTFELESSVKCGITGSHMTVKVDGVEEESHDHHHEHEHEHDHHHDHDHEHEHEHHHDHDHDHDHDHHHEHHHSSMGDIEHIVRGHLNIPDKVKEDVLSVYKLIAEAESFVHGKPVTDIHFHEVGTKDAIADVTAVCLLMNEIGADKVVVSPIHVGSGQVNCAHGILPVPAPATAHILKDVPIYGGNIRGELCTPTGAALLKHFATEFGKMPVMSVSAIGYGMGKKDFEAANCVRISLGESENVSGEVLELSCNIDDMTGEAIGFAMDMLLSESQAAVSMAENVQKNNVKQQEVIEETFSSVNKMLEDIETTASGVHKISVNADACVNAKDAVVEVMASLSAISEENAASSQETGASMQELTATVSTLSNSATSLHDISTTLSDETGFFKED